jgi:PilZ domain.
MRTLRQSGWVKVLQGITTPDEILRVTQSDELPPVSPALEPEPVKPVAASIPPAPAELSAAAAPQKTTTPSVSDRRIYERIEGSIYVRFKIFRTKTPDNAQRAFEPEIMAVTKNISAGGVLFSSSEYIAPGKILDLAVMLTDEEKNIACLARVVRCTELVPNKDFEIAACFLDLSNAERNRLNRYLERSRK